EALHRWFEARPQGALTVRAQRPAGRFLLPLAPERPTVLLAAGIGITPFLGLLETIAARVRAGAAPPTQPMLLLYGNRGPRHHAFGERIAALARTLPMLETADFYSRDDGPAAGRARNGRVGAQHIDAHWLQADARFYACGPPEMLREVREALLARGMPRHAFFAETFGAPAPSATASGPFEVHFVRSGIRAAWTDADRNLLGLAERVGAPLTGGCRVGQCESCRVGVRRGHVHHLAPTDVADEGDCLACIAVPASPLEIDA
ncbi:MAG: iron-sulfur cluster-binding domain-containing protein, partial [Solirubrobacteraceae bacterium]|nr:iron-sulfur cluster-binding domain-containing protein [Solirubrobacteraceae bacterium]